ncbi:DUF4041 domain-containing protein [Cohnella candidum]|uniref:DUF4041 domain-containing protein n=1 Tax=Cohnella candidum TaxID=2674991 RepID=A0A3G3JYI4_9BACL|nr:DUF4041 domain-containing protein [Cohnella candidum]AYQ73304.1 DUF4041 domain-containing protein [Cohnella candidum]
MGIADIFKIGKMKSEIGALKNDKEMLQSLLTPEHKEIYQLKKIIDNLSTQKEELSRNILISERSFEEKKNQFAISLSELDRECQLKKNQLLVLDEQIMLESFSHYIPKYELTSSSEFKHALDIVREKQKNLIKDGSACTGSTTWTVNNSAAEGRRMVNDMIKLVLRSFNNECDSCVENVKFNNIQTFEKRINASFDALNKLGRIMKVTLSDQYKALKLQELYLAHEYQLKKQEEKEEQKQIREQMREEARLQREIEEARKTVDKEKRHFQNALQKTIKQLESCTSDEERVLLQNKIEEFEHNLGEIERQLKDIDYREANQRAGYVYVISNIGAFGENIYKIGMTRRLDPYDRVFELGDASVPFNFDVHAMIFSEDAPKLEAALHREFDSRRLNAINRKREFFNVSLDEIEEVIKRNHDKTIEFIRTADAEQYRETLVLRNNHTMTDALVSSKEVAVTNE